MPSLLPAVPETWLITRVEDVREETMHLRCSVVQGWVVEPDAGELWPLVESTLDGVLKPLSKDLDVETLVVGTRRLAIYLHACKGDYEREGKAVTVAVEGHYGKWSGAGSV
jgi:hypothetical protein